MEEFNELNEKYIHNLWLALLLCGGTGLNSSPCLLQTQMRGEKGTLLSQSTLFKVNGWAPLVESTSCPKSLSGAQSGNTDRHTVAKQHRCGTCTHLVVACACGCACTHTYTPKDIQLWHYIIEISQRSFIQASLGPRSNQTKTDWGLQSTVSPSLVDIWSGRQGYFLSHTSSQHAVRYKYA